MTVGLPLIKLFLTSVTYVKDLHLSLSQHAHQVVTLPHLVLNLLLSLHLCLPYQPLFMLKLSLSLYLILSKRLLLFNSLPLQDAFMFELLLSIKVLTLSSLSLQLLLYPLPLILKGPQLLLSSSPLLLFLFMELLPETLLLIVELLLRLVPHLFHKSLLPYYLILFNLPESPLFFNLYHLKLLIKFLFP